MLRLATREDVPTLNAILNDPSVYPHVSLGIPGPLDFGPVFDHCFFLMLQNEGGFFMLHPITGGLEVHTCFLPGHRGKEASDAGWELLRTCFMQWGTSCIFTKVPLGNIHTDHFTRKHGFKRIGADAEFRFYEMTRDGYLQAVLQEEAACQPQ